MTDDERTAAMAEELARLGPMKVEFRPHRVLQLGGLLQLANRHPAPTDSQREPIEAFLRGVRHYCSGCPTVLNVLREGDDPAHDVPRVRDADTGWTEAHVIVNGRELSFAEAMSLRVAVSSMRINLADDALRAGLGEQLALNYDHHLATVERLLIGTSGS